jgi:hypothetical protein
MKLLSKIERLDQEHPGLADDARKWFAQGISCRKIAALLSDKYQIALTMTPVGRFRCRRWVPEQNLLREKRIELLAAQQIAEEREVRATLAREFPGEAK